MSKTAILGACTAYGIARKYGYTGTEEEWNALQNRLKNEAATYANSARSSASAALTSEQKAATSEANAKAYMDSAEESKNAAFSTTPEGYEANVQKLEDMDIQTATGESLSLVDTRTGGIKIDKIAGKSVQNQYIGKNLFNVLNNTTVSNGITTKIVNGVISLTGTGRSDYANLFETSNFDNTIPSGTTITFSINKVLDRNLVMALGNGNIEEREWLTITKGKTSANITLSSDKIGYWIYVPIVSGETINISDLKILIEISDAATDYEPYVGGMPAPNPDYPQEIESVGDGGSVKVTSCGKNLASDNVDDYTLGYLTDNSVQTANTASIYINDYIFVPSNVNILSIQEKNGFFTKIFFYDEDKNIIKSTDIIIQTTNNTFVTKTISMPENTKFIRYNLCAYNWDKKATKNEVLDEFIDLQFEFGASTEYEPYQSTEITLPLTEPLRSIGDVKDEIVKQDGKWGVLRRICEVSKKKSDFTIHNSTYHDVIITQPRKDGTKSGEGNQLCNVSSIMRNPNASLTPISTPYAWIYTSGQSTGFRISDYIYQTISDDDIITAMYVLATPVFEPFTDQTPFYGLSSFDGVTNIITDQTIEPTMELEYGKSQVGAYALEDYNLSSRNKIDKLDNTGDSKDNTTTFTSADSTTATAWTDVAALATGEKHSSIFNKVSTMFKNIRFLYKMLGTTDISTIGDGTVTNALSTLNSNLIKRNINKQQPILTDFNLTISEFKNLIGCFEYNVETQNGFDTEPYGFAIPFSTNAWLFWLAVSTTGNIYIKYSVNNADWTDWKKVSL